MKARIPEVQGIKRCSRCKGLLSLSAFYNNRHARDRKNPYCKDCHKAYVKEWCSTPKGKASYKASFQRRNRRYYLQHLNEMRARGRAYRKVYYLKHRDEILADRKVHRYVPRNIQRTRLKWQINSARHRALKAALPATLSTEQWEAIIKAYGGRCAYCGRRDRKLTQDHVIPLKKGGGTTSDNIVPACLTCNTRKGASAPPIIPAKRLLI